MRRALAATACLLSLGGLAACGSDSDDASDGATPPTSTGTPQPSESPTTGSGSATDGLTIDITVKGDDITPNGDRVQAKRGEPITLNVDSDRAGELHVHSIPEQQLEYGAGQTTLELTIDTPGIVEVEDHHADIVIVSLEVS